MAPAIALPPCPQSLTNWVTLQPSNFNRSSFQSSCIMSFYPLSVIQYTLVSFWRPCIIYVSNRSFFSIARCNDCCVVNSSRDIRKSKRIIAACIVTFMWSAQTVVFVDHCKYMNDLFIIHGLSLESKLNYYFSNETSVAVALMTDDLLQGLNIVLADVILVSQAQWSVIHFVH